MNTKSNLNLPHTLKATLKTNNLKKIITLNTQQKSTKIQNKNQKNPNKNNKKNNQQ